MADSDRDQIAQLQNTVAAYQAKVPRDDQERRDIADRVRSANNQIRILSGPQLQPFPAKL